MPSRASTYDGLKEESRGLDRRLLRSEVQRRVASLVGGVHVGAASNQVAHQRSFILDRRIVQRCAPSPIH